MAKIKPFITYVDELPDGMTFEDLTGNPKKYELITSGGYDVVKLKNGLFMIDSGCPFCVSFKKDISSIVLNDKLFKCFPKPSKTEGLILPSGIHVDGLIGQQALEKFGILEVDRTNKTVVFGETTKECINEIEFNGDKFNIKVNGVDCVAHFDLGAPIMGVKSLDILEKGKLIDSNHIEPSMSGAHKTPLYRGTLEFNGVIVENDMFHLTDKFYQDTSDAFFSLNNLAKEYYVLDYKNHVLFFK